MSPKLTEDQWSSNFRRGDSGRQASSPNVPALQGRCWRTATEPVCKVSP
jgi:hypothetical protein